MFFYLADILGAQQQSLPVSYFWLMEALRYQSPSVVVPDTYICFPCSAEPLELLRGGGKAGDGFHEMVLAGLYVQDKKTKE
jgi:hypothetical protein|nr:hypothetical protein [uncultured Acetatifactor sp.]